MNKNEKWTGTIIYGKEYKVHQNKELYFDLDLIRDNEKITGTAIDIGGEGASPDPATIKGTIVGEKISFIKQYASLHSYNIKGETTIDKSRKGPEINYTGIYDENEKRYNGHWKMTVTFKILWLIPLNLSASGTWTMKRKIN